MGSADNPVCINFINVLLFSWKTKSIVDGHPIGHDAGEGSDDFGNMGLLTVSRA